MRNCTAGRGNDRARVESILNRYLRVGVWTHLYGWRDSALTPREARKLFKAGLVMCDEIEAEQKEKK